MGRGSISGSSTSIHVADFGASGDGLSDDTGSIQRALDTLASGDTLLFDGTATYLISRTLWVSGKAVMLRGRGARIREGRILDASLHLDRCSGSSISGFQAWGRETAGSYRSGDARPFLLVQAAADVRVSDLVVGGKTSAVVLVGAERCVLQGIDHHGDLSPEVEERIVNSGSVLLVGGRSNLVRACSASSTGNLVLGLRETSDNTVSECRVSHAFDNGIYFSSGNGNAVVGCHVAEVPAGDGIKVRGSMNRVVGNDIRTCGAAGIRATGNGPGDGTGSNGRGSVCAGNNVARCRRGGIALADHDGLPPTDFVVEDNSFREVGHGDFAAAALGSGSGHLFRRNTLLDIPARVVIQIAGRESRKSRGVVVAGNRMVSAFGRGHVGVEVLHAVGARVVGNVLEGDLGTMISAEHSHDLRVSERG